MPEVPALPRSAELSVAGSADTPGYRRNVEQAFASDGVLARTLPAFEPRPGQRAMAMAVAGVIADGGVLLAEAGTGTGKTLAYLVPGILSGKRVLVSTGTKNLQEQIYTKDVPLLRRALGRAFSATYMKGRANYLCLHRFEQVREEPARHAAERIARTLIEEWLKRTQTGDRAEIDELPDDYPGWSEIAATTENCLGSDCPQYGDCFITKMRQRAAESDVVIVNHHLLCADASVRHHSFGEVIPECHVLVVDEAHQLEEVATQYFGVAVSNYRTDELVTDAERSVRAQLIIDRVAGTDITLAIERIKATSRAFFDDLRWNRPAPGDVASDTDRGGGGGGDRAAARPSSWDGSAAPRLVKRPGAEGADAANAIASSRGDSSKHAPWRSAAEAAAASAPRELSYEPIPDERESVRLRAGARSRDAQRDDRDRMGRGAAEEQGERVRDTDGVTHVGVDSARVREGESGRRGGNDRRYGAGSAPGADEIFSPLPGRGEGGQGGVGSGARASAHDAAPAGAYARRVAAAAATSQAHGLFGNVPPPGGGLFDERVRLSADALGIAAESGLHFVEALDALEGAIKLLREANEDLQTIAARAAELRDQLRFLLRADDASFVYFLEIRGGGVFLKASPIDVSSILRELITGRMQATVFTSATLAVNNSFGYMRGRLGVTRAEEVRLPSEFDYRTQSLLYLPRKMPEPRDPLFTSRVGDEVIEILKRTEGRAFVLFTSHAAMRTIDARVAAALPYPRFVQGTAPRGVLLDRFRRTANAVLLATSSFWQGVDVVGDALSCVIIDKLPFAAPGDPITAARIDAINARGGDAFGTYQVPVAILTLLQGIGRLLRHRTDRGVLAILDPRLQTMGYGRRFLASLPPAPITRRLEDIERFFQNGPKG